MRTVTIVVTIEYLDPAAPKWGKFEIWNGSTVKGIKNAVKAKYKDKSISIQYGEALYQNHYGAH